HQRGKESLAHSAKPKPSPRHNKVNNSSGAAETEHRPARSARSALPGLEATLHLVDHVDPTLAADQAICAVTAAQRFHGIADFPGIRSGSRCGRAVSRLAKSRGN